jgi:hypothetical protein
MRSFLCGLIAGTFAVLAPALADDATEAFRQMCLAPHADTAKALAEADRQGWMALPQSMLAEFQKSEFRGTQGRIRSTGTGLYILILGSGHPADEVNVDMQLCGVAAVPGAPEEFEAQAAALSGVSKDTHFSNDKSFYVWREENGKHIQITYNEAGVTKQVLAGAVNFLVTYSDEKKMSIMMLAVPSSAKPEPGKP